MRRARRPKSKEELFNILVDKENSFSFHQRADIFALAACVGYFHNKSVPFDQSSEPIIWEFFTIDNRNVLKIIAFLESKDPNVLLENTEDNGDKMLKIVEAYANGGLGIIEQRLVEAETKGLDRLDAFFELIMEPYTSLESITAEEILKKIVK